MDRVAFVRATNQAKEWADSVAKRVADFNADSDAQPRLRESVCKTCWYHRSGLAHGNAFTRWTCGVCNVEAWHANTGVPKVCQGCAHKHSLCARCGGDFDMRPLRRKWPTP